MHTTLQTDLFSAALQKGKWLLPRLLMLAFFLAGPVQAQEGEELRWKGGSLLDSSWFSTRNWDIGRVPGVNDRVIIGRGGYTVQIYSGNAYADELLITGEDSLSWAMLKVQDATLHIGTRLTVSGLGKARESGSLSMEAGGAVIGGAGAELVVGKDGVGDVYLYDGARMVFGGGVTLGVESTSVGTMGVYGTASRRSVLETGFVARGASTNRYTGLELNGGELKAMQSEASFLRNLSKGFFTMGGTGGWINSNGFDIGVDESNFLEGRGTLFKIGEGTLTLAASGQQNGINVQQGTLVLHAAQHSSISGILAVAPGNGHDARLVMEAGAKVDYSGAQIGYDAGSKGEMVMRGAGTTLNVKDGTLTVGYRGEARLGLESGATVRVNRQGAGGDGKGVVRIAVNESSVATLDFGSADLNAPTTTGTLEAETISFGYVDNNGSGEGKGLVRFNQTDALTLAVNAEGKGEMVQRGTGSTTLTGHLQESVSLRVEQGNLNVDGIAEGTTVVTGGVLGGSGTLGTVHLAGGKLSPGNSPGVMTIGTFIWDEGEVVFDLGSGPSGNDLLKVGQLTTQAAQLSWTFQNSGWEVGETYELLKLELGTLDPMLFSFTNEGGFDGVFSVNGDTLQFTLHAIPEPTSLGMLVAVAFAAGLWRRVLRRP